MDERVETVNSLILQIAEGNKQALETLYTQFGGLLFAMAKKYIFDKSKAEDVVGEVLLKLVRSAKSFKRGYNGLNWLFKSIRNQAFDINKQDGKHRAANIDDFRDIRNVFDFEEQTVESVILNQALDRLTVTERAALYYKFWEGLTVREIAKVMKLARSTAQNLIGGALKKLGTSMQEI